MTKFVSVLGVASLLVLGLTGAAWAHAHLTSAVPATGGTVSVAPTELDLTFSEGVNLKFTGVKVTGPGNAEVHVGDAMLMDGDTTLMVPISGTLVAGAYSVAWHALSTDGHKTTGTYTFTVKP
ncbi:MAG: copper homeostasis periplasmic binding protein CopC [Bauldia sp.]